MSEARDPHPLPLFHRNVVALDTERHRSLKLDRAVGYGYSAGAETIPIGLAEFEAAAHSYPIVFSDSPQPVPVVLLGFRKGWNLFVDADGAWAPGTYVPALVRAFPFALLHDPESGERWLGIEADAACLGPEKGVPLFADGQPTEVVREAMAFCDACQAGLQESLALGEALERAGVLEGKEVTIRVDSGGSAQIGGFKIVARERLDAVPDDVYLEWRRRNWVAPLYAHLFSAARWLAFSELVTARLAARH